MIIVKIGGSLYNTPELQHWLSALTEFSNQQNLVLVPGGGPFADLVRSSQQLYHFNDDSAHHMAIMAMKQFGLLLSALLPSGHIIKSNNLPNKALSIWLPDDQLLSEPSLTKSWDISADSIALWLATKHEAQQLLLIKHTASDATSIKELSSNSIIDHGFAALFANSTINAKIIHYQAYDNLAAHSLNSEFNLQLP